MKIKGRWKLVEIWGTTPINNNTNAIPEEIIRRWHCVTNPHTFVDICNLWYIIVLIQTKVQPLRIISLHCGTLRYSYSWSIPLGNMDCICLQKRVIISNTVPFVNNVHRYCIVIVINGCGGSDMLQFPPTFHFHLKSATCSYRPPNWRPVYIWLQWYNMYIYPGWPFEFGKFIFM